MTQILEGEEQEKYLRYDEEMNWGKRERERAEGAGAKRRGRQVVTY